MSESNKKYVVTYTGSVQVSYEDFITIKTSKIFQEEATFFEVSEWLKSLGAINPNITVTEISYLVE